MKLLKTALYTVTYQSTGGSDIFSGKYILNNDWLLNMINNGSATAVRRG